jgi:hypothetical protein
MLLLAMFIAEWAHAAEPELKPLFNGKDLSGWVNVNVAPNTFTVKEGMIVSTGKPTGVMRTEKQYENFILELEWRHMQPGGNAGLFVWSAPLTATGQPFTRAIEVQILDGRNSETYTSHGDVFSIHGSTMKPDRPHPAGAQRSLPSERRAKPSPEWNHYRVVCNDGVIKLSVNGKEVSGGSECNYRKGYICLESEGSECHFRNIRLAELPATGATKEQTAPTAEDFKIIYTGRDLEGWTAGDEAAKHWKPADWTLKHDGAARELALTTAAKYADFVLICDWRVAGGKTQPAQKIPPGVQLRGAKEPVSLAPEGQGARPAGQWNRSQITVRGKHVAMELNGNRILDADLSDGSAAAPLALLGGDTPTDFANLYIKQIK